MCVVDDCIDAAARDTPAALDTVADLYIAAAVGVAAVAAVVAVVVFVQCFDQLIDDFQEKKPFIGSVSQVLPNYNLIIIEARNHES
ncbi:unnamed protein product [Rotaria sp. Silwood2]|nr:unnamed protein product [Rotaria sp. Silwood2]CAF2965976.1 unnamed protein product [Rotaria sp. Silwood2]CAF3266745.1 unnamed protein product [Rotaria sp. Silwood2]CAF3353808.1 unnamed protein product [Rotaria sp. Silwood2]CAF4157464.1 unnamed protein product [Rotaria sp. Silwood2]